MVILVLLLVSGVVWLLLRLSPLIGHPHILQLARFDSSLSADSEGVVICLGDSLTEGNAGFDYVHELANRLEPWGYTVLNAGINGQLAWNLRQRLDVVKRVDPAFVVLLIGTNDARAIESQRVRDSYLRRRHLPQAPDEAFFHQNYSALVAELAQGTRARVILVTLPPLGECEGEPVDAVVSRINSRIEAEASERGLACVPLNAVLRERLAQADCASPLAYDADRSRRLAIASILQHYLLRWSWDQIAERNGMLMLTDMIHLNGRGGHLLVELVEREIRRTPRPDA